MTDQSVSAMEPRDRTRRRLDVALTVAAVIGSLSIAATVVAMIAGVRPMIFETGSMAPQVPTGSLALIHQVRATDVAPGDVVSVVRDDGVRITHRVDSVESTTGDTAVLVLRGDANPTPDPNPYTVTSVDRLIVSAPILGYVVTWLTNPYTVALQALLLAVLLAAVFAPRNGWRRSSTAHRVMAGTAVLTVMAMCGTALREPAEVHAALAATATASGSIVAGPDNPISMDCTNTAGILGLGDSVKLSWPNTPARQSFPGFTYKLTITGQGATPQVKTYPAAGNPNPMSVDAANMGLLSWLTQIVINVLTGGVHSTTIRFTLTHVVGAWESIGSVSRDAVLTNEGLLGILPTLRCGSATARARGPEPSSSAPSSPSSSPPNTGTSTETTSVPATSSVPDASDPQPPDNESTSSEPTAPAASSVPRLPPGGDLSDNESFAVYSDSDRVTVRDAATTDIVYREKFTAGSTVRWMPGRDTVEVTEPNGAVTRIEEIGGRWTSTAVETPSSPEPESATGTPTATQPLVTSTMPDSTVPEAGG